MSELTRVTAREASQRFSELLGAVETRGEGFLVTRGGVPVARILPVEEGRDRPTTEQNAALARLVTSARPRGVGRLSRDEAYEERVDPGDERDRRWVRPDTNSAGVM